MVEELDNQPSIRQLEQEYFNSVSGAGGVRASVGTDDVATISQEIDVYQQQSAGAEVGVAGEESLDVLLPVASQKKKGKDFNQKQNQLITKQDLRVTQMPKTSQNTRRGRETREKGTPLFYVPLGANVPRNKEFIQKTERAGGPKAADADKEFEMDYSSLNQKYISQTKQIMNKKLAKRQFTEDGAPRAQPSAFGDRQN